MQVEIVTMNQEMSLADGTVAHFIILKLPNEVLVRALVSDEGAASIIQARIDPTATFYSAPTTHADEPSIMTPEEEMQMPIQEKQPSPPTPKRERVRARHVAKDEYGYPIVQRNGVETPSTGLDEDGVGQL